MGCNGTTVASTVAVLRRSASPTRADRARLPGTGKRRHPSQGVVPERLVGSRPQNALIIVLQRLTLRRSNGASRSSDCCIRGGSPWERPEVRSTCLQLRSGGCSMCRRGRVAVGQRGQAALRSDPWGAPPVSRSDHEGAGRATSGRVDLARGTPGTLPLSLRVIRGRLRLHSRQPPGTPRATRSMHSP